MSQYLLYYWVKIKMEAMSSWEYVIKLIDVCEKILSIRNSSLNFEPGRKENYKELGVVEISHYLYDELSNVLKICLETSSPFIINLTYLVSFNSFLYLWSRTKLIGNKMISLMINQFSFLKTYFILIFFTSWTS